MMPRPASHTFAFEPKHIQAMDEAFDAVYVKLQLSVGSEDRLTELVREKIIRLRLCALELRPGTSPRTSVLYTTAAEIQANGLISAPRITCV